MALDLETVARMRLPILRRVLRTGTVLIHQPSPANRIVVIKVFAPVGSVHEPVERAGLANMSVRLLSAGTSRNTEREISLALEANGAHFSADAGKDASTVSLLSTRDFLTEDLSIMLNLLRDPVFPEKQLARDRVVVSMMIREDDDSPFNFTYRLFRRQLLGDHPYGWPSLGLEEAVMRITRDDVERFSLRQRRPDDLRVVVVGGDVDDPSVPDFISERIEDCLTSLRSSDGSSPPEIPDRAESPGVHEEFRSGEAEWIISGTFAPSFTSEDSMPFRVMDSAETRRSGTD